MIENMLQGALIGWIIASFWALLLYDDVGESLLSPIHWYFVPFSMLQTSGSELCSFIGVLYILILGLLAQIALYR